MESLAAAAFFLGLFLLGMRWVRGRLMARVTAATEGAWRETLQGLIVAGADGTPGEGAPGDRLEGDELVGVRDGTAFRLRLEEGRDGEVWPTVVGTVSAGGAGTLWPRVVATGAPADGGDATGAAGVEGSQAFVIGDFVAEGEPGGSAGGRPAPGWLDVAMRETLAASPMGITITGDGTIKVAILGPLDAEALVLAVDVVRYVGKATGGA